MCKKVCKFYQHFLKATYTLVLIQYPPHDTLIPFRMMFWCSAANI